MKYVKKTFKEFIEWHNREGSERRVGGGDGRKSFDKELGESDDGLKAKSEKSGISLGILKQVYSRGMAAYKTGHRPGTTAQQWAFARVNSFITKGKGTWGGADKDLAAKAGGSAKKESMSGAETPPFKSTAGAGEFGTKELELKYRKETPGQSKNKDLGEAKSARARKADSKKAVKTLKDIRKGKYPGVKMANEQLPITEGALGKQWANGAKRVKSGSITLVKAKNPDADLHTVMKNGKKVGTFVFDDGPDAFSVTNISTKKVSWADQIDDIPKMFESKAPALKSSDYAKGTYQSAQAFKDKFAKKKKESVDEASKEGTVRIIDLGNKGQDKIRKELGVDKLPNKGFQVQVMTKGKFVNQGKPYKTMKDAEKVRSTGQHSMQFDEAALEEKTKWKMGDGRPRNGARIENDRFWNLPYDSLKYIAKDAGEAMKANPTARKATTGPGNWADQVADAATVMQWRKKNGIRESVELDEAIDFRKAHQEIMAYAKKSGGIDKTDFEKVAYYVKAIGDNQNTPNVANKAFMAMKKFVGDMDTDPRDGVMLMLKKHGMMKNGRLVQESVEEAKAPALNPTDYSNGASMSATAWKNNEAIIESIIEEGLSAKQIALLKKNYSTIDRIDPTGPAYKKAKGMISGLDKDMMMDLAKAKVKWLSQMAADELRKKHNIKLKAKDYMESMEEAVSVSRKDFETLKKGDKLSITFDSAVRKGNSAKFLVKGKSHSKKYNVDKITLQNIANPGVQKSFLYSRNGGDATMAQGDMGVTIQKYVKEAVRLEGITDEDVAQFVGAASAAKKAGKKNFTFGGKSYPVTISGDVAKKVLEDSLSEKMDPVDHVEKNKESGMYCVYDANGKKLKEFEDKEAANDYAIKNHKKLMAVTESKYTEVEELIESSDKSDAKEMSNLIKEIQPKISNSELKKEVEQMAMEKYKNKIRAKKIASFA